MLWEDLTQEQQEAAVEGLLDVEDIECGILVHWPSYRHPEPPEYCEQQKVPGYEVCRKHLREEECY